MLNRSRLLMVAFFSLALVISLAFPALAQPYQDYIYTYSDAGHTQPEATFGDGETVYVMVTDNTTTTGTTKTINVTNSQEGNLIAVSVEEDATLTEYEGSFIITSGADGVETLHMEHGQTATISANLQGEGSEATQQITADYGITQFLDIIWTYSDPNRTVEATEFGDGDTVYIKVSDSQTRGGIKTITVENNTIGNSISVQIPDSQVDGFYLGYFKVYSQGNDDPNDRLTLFSGQSATITADLASDGLAGTTIIYAAYTAPAPTNLTATALAGGSIQLGWTLSSPEGNVASYRVFRAIVSKEQDYASPLATVPAGTSTYTDGATTPETDVSQYNIYRATSSGAQDFSSPTHTVSVGISSYTDSAATQGQTYYYVVRAQDAAGNADSNTNEAWATAGFAFSVAQIYTKYQDSPLCDLASSTDRYNPTAFTKGKIDEIYLKMNLLGPASLNESSSSIALYRLVNNEAEEVLGSQGVDQGTGWAELSFHLDAEFDPDLDEHSRDDLYWVDITVEDTAVNSEDYDFYFVYDTISPSTPSFGITSFDPTAGQITVSGTTVPDELSDPQEVEIFVNGVSQGTVTADVNYQFIKSNIVLASGTNSVEVQSTDRAGNKSELSESLKLDYNPVGLLSAVFRSVHVVQSGSSIDIIYSVAQPAQITIQVFNLSGEIVKEWQGSVSSDIENRWTWHGRNMYEQEVNNGVYICKINAQGSDGTSEQKIKLLAVVR